MRPNSGRPPANFKSSGWFLGGHSDFLTLGLLVIVRSPFLFPAQKGTKPMSSSAQIAANRENAKLSTGPVTDSGKAASSRNAFSHGLRSAELRFFSPAEEQDFLAWREGFRETHNPLTPTETELFRLMTIHGWKTRQGEALYNACYELTTLEAINGHFAAKGALTGENKLTLSIPGATPAETLESARHDPQLAANLYVQAARPKNPRLSILTLQRLITQHENAFNRYRKELERQIAGRTPVAQTNPIPVSQPIPLTQSAFVAQTFSPAPFRRSTPKIGRNDQCPCGSNLKYKRCCLNKPHLQTA